MSIKIGKYEFDNKEQFNKEIESFYKVAENGKKVAKIKFSAVELGNIVLKRAVKKADEIIEEAVVSNKWHVDILFYDLEEQPASLVAFFVDVNSNGSHGFAGLNYNDYKF